MFVERLINSIFTSNTYIFYFENSSNAWVVDPGDSKPILDWLEENNKFLDGILVTHAHFDHIYGINDLYFRYPNAKIYASSYGKEGMLSSKINRSYYTENPFAVICDHIDIVEDGDSIPITEILSANVIDTPGHNKDCLSFEIKQFLFTGDALIPGFQVHTKSKYSDKLIANESINKIVKKIDGNTIICPGHGDMVLLKNIKIEEIIRINI